jgi:hypothetical protein
MLRLRSWSVLAGVMMVFSAGVVSAQRVLHDLTGKWAFAVVTENGTGTPAVVLKQEGEKLTGTYESRMMGTRAFTGSIKGDSLTLTLEANGPDGVALVFRGVVVDKDNLKGNVDFGGMGGATFTGKREP